MNINEKEITKAFNKAAEKISEERKALREAVFLVLSKELKSELNKNRIQNITENFNTFGLNDKTFNDKKEIKKKLKEEFIRYNNLRKLHSAIFYSDNSIALKLQELFYTKPEAADKIIKFDIHGIMEKQILMMQDIPLGLDDRALQKVLREIDEETLETALIGQPYFVKEKFFRNMSQREARIIADAMQKKNSSVSEEEILKNQWTIIKTILELVEKKEIFFKEKISENDEICY